MSLRGAVLHSLMHGIIVALLILYPFRVHLLVHYDICMQIMFPDRGEMRMVLERLGVLLASCGGGSCHHYAKRRFSSVAATPAHSPTGVLQNGLRARAIDAILWRGQSEGISGSGPPV